MSALHAFGLLEYSHTLGWMETTFACIFFRILDYRNYDSVFHMNTGMTAAEVVPLIDSSFRVPQKRVQEMLKQLTMESFSYRTSFPISIPE